MRDYSNYHNINHNKKIMHDGLKVLEANLNGFESEEVEINGIKKRLMIWNRYSNRLGDSKDTKIAVGKYGDFSVGDYIYWKNKNTLWLVVSYTEDNKISQEAIIHLCNHNLKWQKDCEIISYPCVVTNRTAYKDDVWADRNMILAQGQYQIILPNNDDTNKISIDSRFFIDEDVYRVSYVDRITTLGLITLTLNKDTYDSTIDNRELQIANYIDCKKDIVISNYRKTHTENTSILLDVNYIINDKIVNSYEYQLKFTSFDENIATVDENGLVSFLSVGSVIIEITVGEIVKQFEFIVESTASSSSIEIIGDDEVKQHMTTILTANLMQNGQSVVDDVDWSVDNNNVQIVSVDKNKCTIKGLKIGASVVTAEWNGEKDSKEIKIKSGW